MNEDFIKEQVKALEESVDFYRPGNQWELDKWVVESFLQNIEIYFKPSEIVKPSSDPPDAFFRSASFEVKEILDTGRKRHAEYKKELNLARKATCASDLMRIYTPHDLGISDLLVKLESKSKSLLSLYSPDTIASLDLLCYVNLRHIESSIPDCDLQSNVIKSHGWRSVSFVKGLYAGVVSASPAAPEFQHLKGSQHLKKAKGSGLTFDIPSAIA